MGDRYWGAAAVAAIRLRKIIDNEWWLILSGLLSIAFGAVLFAWPGTGALAVIWTMLVSVIFGCMFIGGRHSN